MGEEQRKVFPRNSSLLQSSSRLSIRYPRPLVSKHPELDFAPHKVIQGISGTGFRTRSGFQSLVGFRIPWAEFPILKSRIPDTTSKSFLYSGIEFESWGDCRNQLNELWSSCLSNPALTIDFQQHSTAVSVTVAFPRQVTTVKMTQRKTVTAAMLNNWLPLSNNDMKKKCRQTALLLQRVNCGPRDTKWGKWIKVLIMKVKCLPGVIIGGVQLDLSFHGSHNHDRKDFENRSANNM